MDKLLSDTRLIFYFGCLAVVCLTVLLTTCAINQHDCKIQAMKNGVQPDKIAQMCNG